MPHNTASFSWKLAQKMTEHADVTVIGAGLAGMSACVHLAEAGLGLCIDAGALDSNPVGESLDWSAPDLLKGLGLPMEHLLEQRIATYKRHVVLKLKDGSQRRYIPGAWLGSPLQRQSAHIACRSRPINGELRKKVDDLGIRVWNDRVVRVEAAERLVKAVLTAKGDRVVSRWFLDASGFSAVYFRGSFACQSMSMAHTRLRSGTTSTFPIRSKERPFTQMPQGQVMWTRSGRYPIHPNRHQYGYVYVGDAIERARQRGLSVQEIFASNWNAFLICETCPKTS